MPLNLEDPEWGVELFESGESADSLIDLLGGLPIFETLTWKELQKLERIVHRRHFVIGEMAIPAWIPRTGLFVVISGSVHVVRQRSDGSRMVLDTLGPGTLLGEFAILDDSPRSSSIVAAEPSDLTGFFRPDLMDLVHTDPTLGFKILYRLAQTMNERMHFVVNDLRRLRMELGKHLEAVPA